MPLVAHYTLGTPLQNSLEELWALLNFIAPEIFVSFSDLDSFLNKDDAPTAATITTADTAVNNASEKDPAAMEVDGTEVEQKPNEGENQSVAQGKQKEQTDQEKKSQKVVEALHKILRPFLLRRVKADVEKGLLPSKHLPPHNFLFSFTLVFLTIEKEINIYVPLTPMQRRWYRSVLEKDIDAVNGLTGKKEGKTRLMNLVMQVH